MSKLSLLEIAQSQLDKTPVIDGQLIVCLDTGNAYRDTTTAHVKIGSDLEVVSDLPLAPLAEKLYYLKPDKLYVFLGGNWILLNDKTIDLDKAIAKLPAGSSTALNDDVEIITQDTDTTQAHYYRRKLVVIWEYIKTKAQDFFAAKNHKHKKADITDFPTSMPASDVYPWAKAAKKPSYTKAEIGLGKVDNTADADKTVKRATTAGTADSANSVAWENVKDKPTTFPVEAHNHDDRYYTEAEVNSKLNNKVDNTEAGANGLINKLESGTAAPVDNDLIITQWANHTTATAANQNRYVRRPMSSIWSYIKSKADSVYQPKGSYAASGHTHDDRYYTETEMNAKLDGKSNTGHTHDDRYYTESEIDSKLSGKANSNHSHYSITTVADNRNTNTTPNDYRNTFIFQGLKDNMAVVGGICFVVIGGLNNYIPWEMPMWKQGLVGALFVTGMELVVGIPLNLMLGLHIWDYSSLPFNLLGQICLPFTVLWFFLALLCIYVDDWMRYIMFHEDKPHYHWRKVCKPKQ